MINTAIILAAGLGSRLMPLTAEVPKPLTEIDGKPILEHQLEALHRNGIDKVVIVVGYRGAYILTACHKLWNKDIPEVQFMWNHDYETTGSAYSLYLAREYLENGCLLIEGDVVFEGAAITKLLSTNPDKSYWMCDSGQNVQKSVPMLTTDKTCQGEILKVDISGNNGDCVSAGVEKLTAQYGRKLSTWLETTVSEGRTDEFKDQVIAEHISDHPIYACDISGLKWGEIDAVEDIRRIEMGFSPMKYVVVIIDGAADNPVAQLDNKTPLEYANIPNIDILAKGGKTGLVRTMYPGLPLGSIVACLGIMGYNPGRYYPDGRASFEAIAQGIYLDEDEIAFRCNSVLLDADTGKLLDATPNRISVIEDEYKIWQDRYRVYPGRNYRNILIYKLSGLNPSDIIVKEPHTNIGVNLDELKLTGKTEEANLCAEDLNELMGEIGHWLFGPGKAISLYPWSPSSAPHLPSFHKKHDLDGAIVSAMDFMVGIGKVARMETCRTDELTGESDTNLAEKLRLTFNALRYNDIVFIHINAPDEESHRKNVSAKVQILRTIDEQLIDPLKQYMDEKYPDNYRIAVLPDHYSLLENGKHGADPVPYLIYGSGVSPDGKCSTFAESSVNTEHTIKSYEFMEFLRG